MTENKRDTPHTHDDQLPADDGNMPISHAALLADMEQVFTEARPRLLRLAHLNGMSPDIADDVVQETMMEAWRHVENLRDPQRFHAWLDGICRNVCRRYKTPNGALHRHFSLSNLARDNETKNAADALLALPDPFAIDPAEELSRQDLATLLDRAMEHLSPDTRKLVDLCYLAEMPQREVALQLGLTIGTLELRLHRARKQLQQVLNGALHADAESFGLALDPMQVQGWRETRQWCFFCGKHRMIGIFETQPYGRVALRLRCPACSNRYDFDVINSGGLVSMEGLSSFRPAIKRLFQNIGERFWIPLTKGACPQCNGSALVSIIDSSNVSFPVPPDRYWVRSACSKCGISTTDISTVFISYPIVNRFVVQHERCISEPYQLFEHDGRPVICARLTDVMSADQLTVLLDVQTLHILAVF
ncbi:MAG TPA: RNA polymerase sigma factor [Ktedonobacteraceae bacterium]|nr:RNA polymerase sigma factor [Ktedonobacteraceae bacterium]